MTRPLRLLLAALLAVAALAVAACGGDSKEASADTDVNTLLDDTFKGNKDVKSGNLNLALNVDAQNAEGVNGPVTLKISGPFQSLE